jgi:hypothetical protein
LRRRASRHHAHPRTAPGVRRWPKSATIAGAGAKEKVSRGWRVSLAVAVLSSVLSADMVGVRILAPLGSGALPRFLALVRALCWGYGLPLP